MEGYDGDGGRGEGRDAGGEGGSGGDVRYGGHAEGQDGSMVSTKRERSRYEHDAATLTNEWKVQIILSMAVKVSCEIIRYA